MMNRLQNKWLPTLATVASLVVILVASGCTKSALRDLAFFRPAISEKGAEKSRREIAREVEDALQGKGTATLSIWHDSFDDAQAAAAESGKPILADFTGGDWCRWCIKLENDVFEKEEFKGWARENVTLLKLDFPRDTSAAKKQNVDLAKRYNVTGYPTVLLLSPEGEVLGKLEYNADVNRWIGNADAILTR